MQPPIIDISALNEATEAEIYSACRDWGVFHVVGHGFTDSSINAMHDHAQKFFNMSAELKNSIARSAKNPWGYYDRELTKNLLDWKEIFDVGPSQEHPDFSDAMPQWPADQPQFRHHVEDWAEKCHQLALKLLETIAKSIGLKKDDLSSDFNDQHTSFLRLNHYPPCALDSSRLGISEHSDAGALTILLQDHQPGLQLKREGNWITIQPVPGALTVNIGDIVHVWSNDRLKAPLHRVITSPEHHRYSAAYFLNPCYSFNYQPVGSDPKYRKINWGEFRAARAAGDYQDYGEEVQISQFKV